jgi:hypothetical protein
MMHRFLLFWLLNSVFTFCVVAADNHLLTQNVSDTAETFWQQSRDWWDNSKETANELWQKSQDVTQKVINEAQKQWQPQDEQGYFEQMWHDTLPPLEKTLALQEQQRDLPDRAWFGTDRNDVQAEINDLLNQAVAILSVSPLQQYRQRIADIEQDMAKTRQALDQARRDRIGAPTESMIKPTVADYDQRITDYEAQLVQHRADLNAIKQQFAMELQHIGLSLTSEQVDFLLATVVGDNLIDLGIVFDHVKLITTQLEQLVEDSGEDLVSARRYYGLYVMLLRALETMHRQVEQMITEDYIPRIVAILERAHTLQSETKQLLADHPERAELLQANQAAQHMTIEAAGLYRDYLQQQQQQVQQARQTLQQDIRLAWNTYETVQVAGELIDLVQSSQRLLDGLLNRQVPVLRPFANVAMKREFEKLTGQLRTTE